MTKLYEFSPWEEHHFWIEILQDHAYFVCNSLSPSDSQHVRTAASYVQEFGRRLQQLEQLDPGLEPGDSKMIHFAQSVQPLAAGYYRFEGHLQAMRIRNEVYLDLSPTYLNGTLSENAEYLRLLSYFVNGKQPEPQPMVDLVDLWLEDQLGHASLLLNYIDVAELFWREQIMKYQQSFSALMVKQRQIRKYLRFTPPGFPVQQQFANELLAAVNGFTEVVEQVVALYLKDRVLNRFTLRFIEHHFPETCYFLRKLTRYAPDIKVTACSLTKPSFTPMNQKEPGIDNV